MERERKRMRERERNTYLSERKNKKTVSMTIMFSTAGLLNDHGVIKRVLGCRNEMATIWETKKPTGQCLSHIFLPVPYHQWPTHLVVVMEDENKS